MASAPADVKPASASGHLGFGLEGKRILQAEGDYRFGRNGQVAVSRERGAQGSRAATCQTTDEQPDAAGRHPSDQHPHPRAAADEGSAAPAFALLGSGQIAGIDVVLGAVDLQLRQRKRHHRPSFEHSPAVGHQNLTCGGGAGWDGNSISYDYWRHQGSCEPVAGSNVLDVDGLGQPHLQPATPWQRQRGLRRWRLFGTLSCCVQVLVPMLLPRHPARLAPPDLVLFVHPASVADNAVGRRVNAAIARQRAWEGFMGEGLTRKGTSNPGFAMQYFSDRSLARLRPFYNFWSMPSMKLWLPPAVLALALAPLAAPLLAGSHPLTALLIRSFFSRLCHQNPARSFVVEGSPVAVCVRCLGIYCGFALTALLRLGKLPGRRLLAAALLLNLLDVAGETLHSYGNLPLPRFLLGLALGIGAGAVLLSRQAELPARRSAG